MKRAILCTMFVFLISTLAFAHPPQDIKITFDAKTKTLTAVIFHNVSDTKTHYIKKVDISLDGKEIITQDISRQDNEATQTVSYLIPDANENSVLGVEAYCSLSGNLEKEIRAGK